MKELPETRQSLLIRLSARHEESWAEFLQIYEQAILDFCRSRGLQAVDAEDVTQEVLAAVGDKVTRWDADGSKGKFRGWLFRVARNMAINQIRKRARQATPGGGTQAAEFLAEIPSPNDSSAFDAGYHHALLQWASSKVRPEVSQSSWEAFWNTTVEGMKAEQVAEQLQMSVGAVYTAKCRVFARIKKVASRFEFDSDGSTSPALPIPQNGEASSES